MVTATAATRAHTLNALAKATTVLEVVVPLDGSSAISVRVVVVLVIVVAGVVVEVVGAVHVPHKALQSSAIKVSLQSMTSVPSLHAAGSWSPLQVAATQLPYTAAVPVYSYPIPLGLSGHVGSSPHDWIRCSDTFWCVFGGHGWQVRVAFRSGA